MGDVQEVISSQAAVSQSTLSDLGKQGIREFFKNNPLLDQVSSLWMKLVNTTTDVSVTDKHLTTSCNAVAVFLANAVSNSNHTIRQFALSLNVWLQAFNCAQRALKDGKQKPAVQILDVLALLIEKQPDDHAASHILRTSGLPMIQAIILGDSPPRVKQACISISSLLRKTNLLAELDVIIKTCLEQVSSQWETRLSSNNILSVDVPGHPSHIGNLLLALLLSMRNIDIRSAALKLFSNICHPRDDSREGSMYESMAADCIELYILKNESELAEFANSVLPIVLDDHSRYRNFLIRYSPEARSRPSKVLLYLAVLRIGRLKRFLSGEELPDVLSSALGLTSTDLSEAQDKHCAFRILLRSSNADIRIFTYDLLVTSHTTNAIVPAAILETFLTYIKCLHDSNDAHQRGELLSVTRRFVVRLDTSFVASQKVLDRSKSTGLSLEVLRSYSKFVQRFIEIMGEELAPGVSYQRHILALQTLQHSFEFCQKVLPTTQKFLFKFLLNLVLDSYEDIRENASSLLKDLILASSDTSSDTINDNLLNAVNELSARTGRSDNADAAGRFGAMLYTLLWIKSSSITDKRSLAIPNQRYWSIIQALEGHLASCCSLRPGSRFPLHANLLAIVHVLDSKQSNIIRLSPPEAASLIQICQKIWQLVQKVLCIDSPERATEDSDESSGGGPKDLLSYSWRALRDSSLVLQAVISASCESEDVYKAVGDLCMEQLSTLRHRGAFSTVAQTFAICCETIRRASSKSTKPLIGSWYQTTLQEINIQARRLTRRSAGLPAMIVALLSPLDKASFVTAIQDLTDISNTQMTISSSEDNELRLPQVHALNCLKEIMTNSKFRVLSEQYLVEILHLAARNMASEVWALRNCGLMLLRACINRLDRLHLDAGVTGPETVPQQSAVRSPEQIAVKLLESSTISAQRQDLDAAVNDGNCQSCEQPSAFASENVFAALDLLRNTTFSPQHVKQIHQLVQDQFENPIWAVRDHAARMCAAFPNANELLSATDVKLKTVKTSTNGLHGLLLSYRYLLKDLWTVSDSMGLIPETVENLNAQLSNSHNPFIQACLLDIANDSLEGCLGQLKIVEQYERFKINIPELRKEGMAAEQYHLRSRVMLHNVLLWISDKALATSETLSDRLPGIRLLCEYPDEARYVIERIMTMKEPTLFEHLVVFFADLIAECVDEEVLALAMTSLSDLLEASCRLPSIQQAEAVGRKVVFAGKCNRGLRDASLRVEAHCLARKFFDGRQNVSSSMLSRVRTWLHVLQSASHDELELSTRLDAARAAGVIIPCIFKGPSITQSRSIQSVHLHLLVVLYDQLNDDDEDVREIAVKSAAECLRARKGVLETDLALCALAAREALLGVMVDLNSTKKLLAVLAISKITAVHQDGVPTAPILKSALVNHPVDERIQAIIHSLEDLFAEERQNLYIDDFGELQNWSFVLTECKHDAVPSQLWHTLCEWTLQGLNAIMRVVIPADNRKNDYMAASLNLFHPLGATYNSEVLILFARVLTVAKTLRRIFITEQLPNDGFYSDMLNQLEEKLNLTHESFTHTEIHSTLLRTVTEALSNTNA